MSTSEELKKAIQELSRISALLFKVSAHYAEMENEPSEKFERLFDSNFLLSQESKKVKGGLATQKEYQMLINLKGVSINPNIRKDGRYQGYVTLNGKRIYIYAKTIDEMVAKISKLISQGKPEKKKKPTATKCPTLTEWLDKWSNLYKKPNLKPTTYNALFYVIRILNAKFGNKTLNQLTTDELQEFFAGYKAHRMRDSLISALKQSLEKAFKQGLIKRNPCDGLEIKSHVKKHRYALTLEEQTILLEKIKGKTIEPIFTFLLMTGLRVGEALALTSSDIDKVKKEVTVNKNVVFVRGQRIIQDSPKTQAGIRTVPIPDKAFKFIKNIEGDVFAYTYNAICCSFKRLQKETGFNVSAHVLRHTYATRLEESGIPPKVKQYLLGHASLDMTQNVYTDVQKGYVDLLSDKIKSAFS